MSNVQQQNTPAPTLSPEGLQIIHGQIGALVTNNAELSAQQNKLNQYVQLQQAVIEEAFLMLEKLVPTDPVARDAMLQQNESFSRWFTVREGQRLAAEAEQSPAPNPHIHAPETDLPQVNSRTRHMRSSTAMTPARQMENSGPVEDAQIIDPNFVETPARDVDLAAVNGAEEETTRKSKH